MRFLAIDLGAKRTGIAIGDDETGIVAPEAVITQPPGALLDRELDSHIEAHRPDVIVVGLPLNMDGGESEASRTVRLFGESIASRHTIRVEYQDERLTSVQADWDMGGSGLTHAQKKRLRDALAASVILRDYLDSERD
ncbi:MAG: Holliday junction resolvase RuvX [Planctomycetota bacterium]|jgi:putative Holliday junction resolvase